MIIRNAVPTDLQAMTREGEKFLHFLYPGKELDLNHLRILLIELIRSETVLVAEYNNKVIGAIGGIISQAIFFPDERELQELFWWVAIEHRGSSAALRLLKEFIKMAKKNKVNRVIMHMESISPLNDDVYLKRGFKLREKAFIMEV